MSSINIEGSDPLNIRYVLEVRKPGGEPVFHELTWVESAMFDEEMPVSVAYGVDDRATPVVQRSRIRRSLINLTGSFGVEPRPSPTAEGRIEDLDGYGRLRALNTLLRDFVGSAVITEGVFSRASKKVELWLHCLQENESYRLASASLSRSASLDTAPGDASWSLKCVSVLRVDREVPPIGSLDAVQPRREVATAPSAAPIESAQRRESGAVPRTQPPTLSSWEFSGGLLEAVDAAVQKGAWVELHAHTLSSRARSQVENAGRVLTGFRALGDAIFAMGRSATAAAARVLTTLRSARAEIAEALDEREGVEQGAGVVMLHDILSIWGQIITAVATLLARSRQPFAGGEEGPTPSAASGRVIVGSGVFRAVPTLEGETVMEFAGRTLGDFARWPEIVDANGMHDPNTLRDGSPFVAGGAVLLVPDPDGAPRGITNDLVGTAYWLDPETSDLVMDSGGLRRTGGAPLILQALRERARNVRGRTPAAPDWGLLPIIGTAPRDAEIARFAVDARAQFYRDPRVSAVRSVTVSRDGDVVSLGLEIEAVVIGGLHLATPIATTGA